MTKPRNQQINLSDTTYYHCISRCVRRAFLCGKDHYTGRNYEHRRKWVEKRIHLLSTVYAIDVCAYAVMSNHTHLVLSINEMEASQWCTKTILYRWHKIHCGTILTRMYLNTPERLNDNELKTVVATAEIFRERMKSISWFMRDLNEPIARKANEEDNCTGRFWEGRFKSQALLDEAALLSCMAYVDLNPMKAGIARTVDSSLHTSIFHRIKHFEKNIQPPFLKPFNDNEIGNSKTVLPFKLQDYLRLLKIR